MDKSKNEVMIIMMDDKNTCPLCGNIVIYDGGYIQCQDPACGWNKPTYFDISKSTTTSKDVIRGKINRKYLLIPKVKISNKLCLASTSLKIAVKYNKVS